MGSGLLVSDGISGPWLIAIVLLLLGAFEALQSLPGACLDLPGTAAAATRLNRLSALPPLPRFVEKGQVPAGNTLHARNISFYRQELEVLSQLDLEVPFGEHLAIMGPSGGGKSSLVSLLTRLETPASGILMLGNMRYEDIDEFTLRQRITGCAQSNWAQTATIADNLRLANPAVTTRQMHEVLALVGMDDVVAEWRDGLNTWVEEGGNSLSGGQRRRLGIARALLKEAPITILDEPTEGLEPDDERDLISRLHCALRGRTLIWITHRAGAVGGFDRVLELTSGRLHPLTAEISTSR